MTVTTWKQQLYKVLTLVFKNRGEFTLTEVYQTCCGVMSYLYPKNNTIEASIRRNLEELRDDGLIVFVDYKGTYSLVNKNS
jgi:Fe2+ or Zn2+ uptake regulation protein